MWFATGYLGCLPSVVESDMNTVYPWSSSTMFTHRSWKSWVRWQSLYANKPSLRFHTFSTWILCMLALANSLYAFLYVPYSLCFTNSIKCKEDIKINFVVTTIGDKWKENEFWSETKQTSNPMLGICSIIALLPWNVAKRIKMVYVTYTIVLWPDGFIIPYFRVTFHTKHKAMVNKIKNSDNWKNIAC